MKFYPATSGVHQITENSLSRYNVLIIWIVRFIIFLAFPNHLILYYVQFDNIGIKGHNCYDDGLALWN